MALIPLSPPGRRLLVFLEFGIVAALGCRQREQIESYTVPKQTNAAVAGSSDSSTGEPTDRMLAAVLPAGDQAWFFKAVGPIPEIDMNEKEINNFFAGLTLGDDGKAHWKLPAGWK